MEVFVIQSVYTKYFVYLNVYAQITLSLLVIVKIAKQNSNFTNVYKFINLLDISINNGWFVEIGRWKRIIT